MKGPDSTFFFFVNPLQEVATQPFLWHSVFVVCLLGSPDFKVNVSVCVRVHNYVCILYACMCACMTIICAYVYVYTSARLCRMNNCFIIP